MLENNKIEVGQGKREFRMRKQLSKKSKMRREESRANSIFDFNVHVPVKVSNLYIIKLLNIFGSVIYFHNDILRTNRQNFKLRSELIFSLILHCYHITTQGEE